MEENKIINVGDVANEQMVENKKNDAKQKYDNAIGASGDSWADELMADDIRKQPKTASVKSGNTASGDDWADQMMTDDVRRTQQGNTPPQNVPQNVPQGVPQGQPTPKEIEAAHQSAMEAQYQQVPALKALDEETDPVQSLRMAQRMMQGDYADLEMANQQGGGASSASAPRGANYTQAPRFSDNLDTWKYTKTITTYDEGHPLAQAARHANDYGNQLSAVEKAQVYANKSWDDLNRQSQELMRRHPVKEKNSQQFEHDAQLLAAIHNQMVALEYNFSDQNDMYKNIGQKNLRMYLDAMRNSGNPYVAQYEEMFRHGRNFRDFNPFVYDLPDAVLNQREKDISLGEKKPDNYYLHMALRDKDFSNRYHAWSYFGSIQDNMSWGKYKNLGAQVNDLRDERFKEERAKAFAETPGYTITAGLLDSFIGKTVATVCNAYDIIAGNPLRTESLNDTLKRSMKYASGGSNAIRGIVSFVPDAVTLMPVTGTGAMKAVGALSKLFEITPKAAKFLVAGGSFMGYEIANTIASAWAEGEAPNVAEVIGNGCKGLLLGTAGGAVNAGVTGVLPKATGRAANYAVRAVGDVAEVGVFVSAEMGMAVASGEHPDFQASLLNNGALIISMKVGHAIAGKGFGIRRDISKSAIEKARALGYDTLADEMVRHNSGRFRNVESAGYSAEALKQLQQIQQNMGKHNVNWREYADMLKPTGASMTRPGVNSVEMVEEDGGYRIVNLDINGVEIDRSKNLMPKDKAEEEVVSRQKKIEWKKERANVEAFDNMRDGHIHATAARRVADQINAEMGAQAVNEDGTPNPDYDGITAQDVLSSFSAIGKKHPATRTPEEQRLMDLFLQEFEDIRMSSPDSNMIKETICEQYGVSKEDFDAAWSKEPGKRGKGAVAQACAAFNTAMSRSYSNVGGDPIIGKVTLSDGRVIEDSVLTRVEVGEDRKPVNPDQKIYYLDEDGNTQVISASEVVAMDLQADLGAQADKIAAENRQRKMEQQQQVVAERLADVQSSVLETHLVELQKQIEGGEDADGRLSVAYNSIAKELDRRYQAEYDGLTQAEKAQRFAESKFPDATPEEKADVAQYYAEHPQEFETALHYDSIHNGELKALIDTMELRNPVEWMKKFNEYKGDESAFREAYKKKFGVDPTERPYGFKEEVAKEKAAESAEEDFDAENAPVEGEDIVEEETVTDGTELPEVEGEEESDVSADTQEPKEEPQQQTEPAKDKIGEVVEGAMPPENTGLGSNIDLDAEMKRRLASSESTENTTTTRTIKLRGEAPKQEPPKSEPPKQEEPGKADPIDELLDRQGITEDVARQKMRETYEQNPDYFEEEYEREFGKKPEVAKKEEVKEETSKSGMPMKEVDGKMKPDFEKATPEQTIDYLLNEKGYSREQVAKMVEKEVAKKVAAVEEKEKAVADTIARQEKADQAQPETELDFDNMDAYDAEVEKINADKAAASEAVEKANKELGDALRERAKWEKTAESLSEREKKEDATPKEEPKKSEEKKEEPKNPEEKKEDSKEEPPAKEQPKEEKEAPKEEEKNPEPPKEEKNSEEKNKSKFDKTAVKERVAKFKTDTPEEREAFSKSVPKMSDEELLAYMETDGKGEYAKAEHPEVYDEYDKRHKDEYLDEYNKEMQSLLDAETSLVSAKAMRSEIDSSDPNLVTASRASFRAKRDALDNYIEDPSQKAWKKANKYKPKQDYDLDEKAPDESRPNDHGIQEEDKEEWQKIAEKVNDEGIVNHINKVAKKLKMPIRMYDGAKGDDGYTQNGVIYVNRNNDNPEKTIAFVIGHEVTHGLQQKAQRIGSDAYDRYREAACDYKRLAIGDEAYEELVNEKMDTYKKRLSRDAFERARLAGATIEEAQYASDRAAAIVTREYIEDEIASDVTGDFVQNPDKYMDWFREARNMSQARRILEGIRDWFATHFSTVYKKNSKLAEARDKFNALYNEVIETEQLKTFEEKTVTSMTDMASSEKRHSYGTEPDVMKRLRNWLRSSEAKKLGWTPEKADNVLRETETLINTLDKALQGDKNYDEWRLRQPTIRVDWRDGEEHPVVTWSRGNIEYKYDMSADLLCINNEGLEEVLSAPAMVDILINGLKETDITNDYKGNFGRKDYARLYQTLKDLGITVPCPGCFDFATRLDMLPSSAKKFTDAVNKVIDERNKDPEAFDNRLRERAKAKGNALANGLPASAKNTQEAIEVAVAGDNATKHIHWHDMLTADGQTGMLADYGGIFRAWQRLGSAKPKDKLLPEPWIGEMTNTGITTIIAPYGKKTPSFREMEVNQGTGLRRNSHSEFRMTLIIDEIQMLREAFMKNLTVFKYMKELDDVRLFGKLGVKYNMSFFPAFDPKGTAAGLGPNGEYIAAEESVGGREFPYIGEDGKTHYDGMRGRDEAMKHCNENVSLSSVAFSVPHLIKLLTDVPTPKDKSGWVGSIIGFHKTNGTAEQLAAQGLGRVRAIEAGRDKGHLFEDEAMSDWDKGVTNFEQVQNDRFGEDWVAIKNGKEKPVSYGHKMEFVGSKVYYNKRTGYYLFPEGYAHESELPGGKFTESVRNNPPHPFVVDYNDKVRELNSDYGYKDAADFYVQELSKLGMIPRFEFTVPEKVFLDACKAAGVDPRHPKLGWKGEGNDWHVVDSDAYYSLWCDYGMTDPATGKWSPHRPVGFINEKGEREFRLPDNAVEIAQEGMRRYTERREKESAMVNDAIREFAKRSVEQGRMDAKQANKILKAHGINPEGDGGKRMSLSGRKSRAEEIAEEYGDNARGLNETVRNTKVDVNDEDSASYEMSNTRYSLVHDPKELNRLESEIAKGKDVGYVVRYRAVANIEGGHVNPMASKEDGKMRTPFNEGDWEKHEVQDINITPEVQKRIDELDASAKSGYVDIIPGRLRYIKGSKQPGAKGTMKYHLVKDDGSSLWAAYNPWLHSSDTPLNDQFSGAWNRPNLSVIEVYIPISDLNDKTPVKYAKDTVGNTPWKSGPVNGALPKGEQRTVTLSRYAKIGKELSNSEQADLIAPKLLKHNVSVPFNTVTPGLRDELARRGVEITAPEKGSGNACNVAYEEWLNGGEQPRYSISYHGSGAEFDKFDHNHMGEGEGAQAYGWGTYVTSVKGIGKTYATESAKKNPTYYWKGQKIDRASINPLSMAYDVVEREGTIKKAISLVDRFLDNPDAHENWAEVKEILKQSKKSDFTIKPARYLYEVDIPDNNGENYISWDKTLPKSHRRRIAEVVRTLPEELLQRDTHGPNWLRGGVEQLANMIEREQYAGKDIVEKLRDAIGDSKRTSEIFYEAGFVGTEYPSQYMSGGRKDGSKNYVIFNTDDAKIVDRTRFSLSQGEYADKLSELLQRRRNGEDVTDELRQLNEDWKNEARQAAQQFTATEELERQNRATHRAEQEAQRQENKDAEREGRMPIQFLKVDLPTTGYEDPQSAVGMAQAAQVRAVLRGDGSRETRRTAVRQLTATMRDLHKAMRAQRDYDRAIVGEVVDLVKTYGDLGLLDDATAGEVKKLLTAIKDSTGAEDLHDATTRVLDVVLGAQSRNIKDTIKTLLSTQAAKIGAKGVVEGKMDILGQTAMKELNDWMGRSLVGCNSRLNELSALRAAAEAKVASASGEAEKARAENELAKVKIRQTAAEMAKNYADRLEATEENIRQIENELEQLKQDYKDKIVKGKEYREQKHLLESLLRENRIDQLQTLWDSVNDVHTAVAEGLERGKMFAERQQEHADEIRHDANKDLEGVSTRTQDRPGALAKVANNVVVKGASASLYTLDTMLRTLGHKAINGEGFLYERFGRGWLECRDNEITGFWANRDAIDAKAKELFGVRKFSDLIAKARGMKKINVRYFDGGEMLDHKFDQAQALYVYMVNKMDDGAIKLRRMGITEEDVNAIKAQLDDRFVKLADWLQGDFLKRKHAEYNEVHERMFGAPMANIENYVPLRIDQRKRSQEVDISKQLGEEKLSSTTGGIIERVHNTSPLDLLNTNAIDLVLDHLQEMNHWQHFAEWNRDVNTLLSDTTFRNKVMNSKTIYGSGKQLWDRLNQVFQLAGGVYRPKGGDFDTAVVRIAQGVSAAKVSFRVFTAAKQLLSLPVFATECDPHLLLKNVGELFSPVKSGKGENSFKWCMENLPSFKERWKGRMAGDTRLESTELDWSFTKKNIVQWASKFGLTPNAFIDACTVAAGAKSVYETKRGRYIKQGYSEAQADKLAKQDATVAFNQSQQSSEKMFVAPMQVDRTGLAVGASLFRNASMGYERKMVSGVKDTSKFLKGSFSGWKKERAFLERMYQERGLTDTQAKRAAWSTVIRHGIKSMLNIAMYSVGAQAAWNIGGKLPYLIFGDNGDEKRKILKEELIHAALGGWLEGLPFGDNVSNGINNYYCGNKWNTFDPALLPLQADIMKIIQKFDKDFAGGEKTVSETWSAITDVIGLGIQSGIGVNPETFTSVLASIVDWGWGRNQTKVDFGLAKEALFFALRFVNTPNTQLDQMYIDEIGMTGAEARKFTPEEIAKRYAFYKTHGSTITAWHLYSREQQDKIVAKYEDAFMKKIGAKDETVDDYIAHAESLNSQNARNTQYNKAYKEVQKNGTAADAWKYYQQELEKFKATGIKQHATCATKWHDIYQEMAGLVPPGEEKEKEDQNVMVSVKDLEKEQKVALLFDAEENSKYLGFTKTIARYTGSSDGGESKLVNELRKLGGSISKKQGGWYFTGENANKAEKMYQQHKEEADRCALATFDKKRVDELINAMNDRRNDYMSDDAMRQIMELCDYWENKMLEDQKKKEKK